jgi:hypothetical protein
VRIFRDKFFVVALGGFAAQSNNKNHLIRLFRRAGFAPVGEEE